MLMTFSMAKPPDGSILESNLAFVTGLVLVSFGFGIQSAELRRAVAKHHQTEDKVKYLILTLGLFLAHSASAYDPCLTPAESRQSYRNCMEFLKLTPDQQAISAQRAGLSRSVWLSACLFQKRKGLAGMLAAERQYCRAINSGTVVVTPSNPNSCRSKYDCVSGQHCVEYQCVDIARVQCKNAHSCSSGDLCIDGECR